MAKRAAKAQEQKPTDPKIKDAASVPSQRRTRMTNEQRAEIANRLANGESPQMLAGEFSKSLPTILAIRRTLGTSSGPKARAMAPSQDSEMKRRLLAFAVISLLEPEAVDKAEADALRAMLQSDLEARLRAVRQQYLQSL
jgi:hypothetical protein